MYSDATIGDRSTESAATSNTDCSNTNGGIQNFGTTWLGYLSGSVKAKLNYGIYRNYSGSGAGITNKDKDVEDDNVENIIRNIFVMIKERDAKELK